MNNINPQFDWRFYLLDELVPMTGATRSLLKHLETIDRFVDLTGNISPEDGITIANRLNRDIRPAIERGFRAFDYVLTEIGTKENETK